MKEEKGKNIEPREITQELRESYLDYAMSVIVSRALPDVRDGLKPVQRRILWAMWDSGLSSTAKLRKSANVVGEVLGRYHPHGDLAVYDAMTRMVQEFSLRYPLINGQGNWGSIEGDSQAAMRYCVTGDTLVVTEEGLLPIKNISSNKSENINIKILSKDRHINKASKWFDSNEHPVIKVTTDKGFVIKGTSNHPLLIWHRNPLTGQPEFQWKLLGQISQGDVAVLDRSNDLLWPKRNLRLVNYWPEIGTSRRQLKKLPEELDKNLAHILGALLAEGSISKNKIEFCNSDYKWIEEFKKRWQLVFPDCQLHQFHCQPSSYGKMPYQRLEIHSRQAVEFLKNLGLEPIKSGGKKIPGVILRSPKSVAAEFCRAFFEGDGSVSSSGKMIELSAVSKSDGLISQLQLLLLRFGIAGTKRFDKYRGTHKLYIRGLRNYLLFKEQIDFVSQRKKEKLNKIISALKKDFSQTDFVPFLRKFVNENLDANYQKRRFAETHNFDRYSNMALHHQVVATAVHSTFQAQTENIFEQLLANNYVFDPIVAVENAGVERVYSLRVDSQCHSFVANGFINHNTECRMAKVAEELLTDIEKETVDWQSNYDSSRLEPKYLPAKLPNLLLNGAMGIAVGMATSIPPHNLNEVVDAVIHLIDKPKASGEDLMQFIKGPDFPTGGIIYDSKAITSAYLTGRGAITCRGAAEVKDDRIEITEVPYQVNVSDLLVKIADLVTNKKIEGIRNVRNESDKDGLRLVIELKKDSVPQKVLNQLYKYTDLQKDFHLNMVALADGLQPQVLSLVDILKAYIEHRKLIVRRRAEFELRQAKEQAHILIGLDKALSIIDKVIAAIKKSKDREDAFKNLVSKFKFTEIQANAILEMRLQTLAALERKKIEDELKEKKALIKALELLLKDPKKILNVIKDELQELKQKYGDERRTKVVAGGLKVFSEVDLIKAEEVIITVSRGGYIKRVLPTAFRSQHRGGKGLIGSEVAEEDFLEHFMMANTHDNMLFFTDRGRVFQTKVWEIPVGSRTAKGKLIYNFLEIPTSEKVSAIIAYSDKKDYLVMATKKGMIKKTSLEDFSNVRRTGIIAISLKKDDLLQWVKLSSGKDDILLTTRMGQAIRFKESQVRPMGRTAAGVTGIRLREGDEVSGLIVAGSEKAKDSRLLVVMEKGFGKQTTLDQYKVQGRGGSGIKTAKITSKTGQLTTAHLINGEEELFVLSAKGQMIRTKLSSIRSAGRATQGVKIMSLRSGDKIVGAICL